MLSRHRHLLLAMQAVGGFLAGADNALAELFRFLRDLVPVVTKLFQNLFQGLREGRLQVGASPCRDTGVPRWIECFPFRAISLDLYVRRFRNGAGHLR